MSFSLLMYTKTTKSINITVNPYYLEDQSDPEEQHFVWAYQVTINNLSKERVQLKNRFWQITDSNGIKHEVRGEGVVGVQPHIMPGESYEYTSAAILETPVGCMQGSYEMIADDGIEFDAPIPVFNLAAPNTLH